MAKKTTKVVQQPPAPNLDHIAEQLRPLAVAIEDLTPDPANARKHGPENLAALRGSLRKYGQRKPIVVNKRDGTVEAGNGTLSVAVKLGWTHLAVVYVDDDPSTAAGFAISDNRTAELAEWDTEALDKILHEIETGDEDLQEMLGQLAEQEQLYPSGDDDASAEPKEQAVENVSAVLVECATEKAQRELFEEMQRRGFKCRVLTV